MEWHLYKSDDPNTWPKIDCPMVVCFQKSLNDEMELHMCKKFVQGFGMFMFQDGGTCCTECYYAYVGYVPSGYKTLYPIICTCRDCPEGYDDNGYCMDYDNDYICGCKKEVAEYAIEEKRIWKVFE
jgi:hypothetical protein